MGNPHAVSQNGIYSHVTFDFSTHKWIKCRWIPYKELFSLKVHRKRNLERVHRLRKQNQNDQYRK